MQTAIRRCALEPRMLHAQRKSVKVLSHDLTKHLDFIHKAFHSFEKEFKKTAVHLEIYKYLMRIKN